MGLSQIPITILTILFLTCIVSYSNSKCMPSLSTSASVQAFDETYWNNRLIAGTFKILIKPNFLSNI